MLCLPPKGAHSFLLEQSLLTRVLFNARIYIVTMAACPLIAYCLATFSLTVKTKISAKINVVARMLQKLRTSKGDYWIKQWFSSIATLFIMGTSLKGKHLAPRGSEIFPLRAVPYDMENHFFHTRSPHLNITILLRTCVTA